MTDPKPSAESRAQETPQSQYAVCRQPMHGEEGIIHLRDAMCIEPRFVRVCELGAASSAVTPAPVRLVCKDHGRVECLTCNRFTDEPTGTPDWAEKPKPSRFFIKK